jgi:hypothetical protein
MTIDAWLQAATADADRRGLPELKPLLETLARATTTLRAADFNGHAGGQSSVNSRQSSVDSHQSSASRHRSGDTKS